MVQLDFTNQTSARVSRGMVQDTVRTFYKVSRVSPSLAVSVIIIGNAAMQKLNRTYRHKNKPTDVLSFSERDTQAIPGQAAALGEVFLCYPYAKKQARERGHSVTRELQVLLVHGLAHLIGHTHDKDLDTRAMERLEKKVLTALT